MIFFLVDMVDIGFLFIFAILFFGDLGSEKLSIGKGLQIP